jgi:MYXO-CTERM domain-containing protein
LEGCATETFKVQMVDDAGFPLASPSQASFCTPTDAGVVVGPSTFANETRVAPCVTGTLGPDGSATITLTPSFPVGFQVVATSPDVASAAVFGVQWDPGPPSPQATDLMWLNGADPKQMKIRQGTQVVRLIPRDACGFSALSRSSEVVLVLPDELLVGAPLPDYDAGAIDRPIQLDVCPPAAADIFIRARTPNNQPVVDGSGAERVLTIVPLCNPVAMDVGCGGCASGPGAGPSAAALAMAAVILRAARRRRRAAAPARRSAAGP